MKKIAATFLRLTVNCSLLTVIFLLFLVSCCFLLAKPVHAGECDSDPTLTAQQAIDKINKCAIEKNVFDDKIFNENQIAGTADSLLSLLSGRSQLHPDTNDVTAGSGALAASGRMIAALYSVPPVSGVQYFAQKIQKFSPVQPVYAQTGTIGFDTLTPVQGLWSVFRNISYVGFVLVFVIIGFMIMFRAHISPQAVATVQDTIPRIIIALILVTFSYAIAGLMIDLMFIILNVIIRAIPSSLLPNGGDYVFQNSVFGVIMGSWKDVFSTVFHALSTLIDNVVNLPMHLDKIIGFFGGSIAGIVIGIALLVIMFRVFLMLLMAYVMIIILTMIAPFFFLIQALPGNNGAKEWFKQMAANVSVFPVTALMFIFAGIIGGIGSLSGTSTVPISGTTGQFPLLSGGIDQAAISKLIGIGLLLMTPEVANMVKKAIGAQGGIGGMGAAAAAGIGAGAGALSSSGKWAMGGPFSPVGDWRQRRAIRRQSRIQRDVYGGAGGTRDGGGAPPLQPPAGG